MYHYILVLSSAVLCILAQDLDSQQTFNESLTRFSVIIFRTHLSSDRGNKFLCQVSIATVLAMLQQGARDSTVNEITDVLYGDAERNRNEFKTFIHSLKENIGSSQLTFSSIGYANFGHLPSRSYESVISNYFSAVVKHTDFTQKQIMLQTINDFTTRNTNNVIRDLVSADLFNTDVELLLLNTLYLKDSWLMPFQPNQVNLQDFYVFYERPVKVPVMRMQKELKTNYLPQFSAHWLQLPLQNSRFYLLFLVPIVDYGLDSIVDGLEPNDLFDIMRVIDTAVTTQLVDVMLPKFRFQADSNFTKVLNLLGISTLFNKNQSNLCSTSSQGMYVADVIQRAVIDINENGIEFVAATLATENMEKYNLCRKSSEGTVNFAQQPIGNKNAEIVPTRFYALRPFLTFLIDGQNKVPLFSARIVDPSKV